MKGYKRFLYPPLGRITASSVLVSLVLVLACVTPLDGAVTNSFTLGYDSFIDRFTILEDDTVEAVHEFYASLNNNLSLRKGNTTTKLRNIFKYGNQTLDESLDGELSIKPLESTSIDLRSNLQWKHFREESDYAFGNDYIQSNTYLRLRREFGDRYRIIIKNRFEIIDYKERTIFDYDYSYFDTGLELEGGSYFGGLIRLGATLGYREVPDTTALSYNRISTDLEIQLLTDNNTLLHLTTVGDRRGYKEDIRSSYWNILSYADLTRSSLSGRTYSLKAESELALFDEPDSTFFDTHFLRTGFKAKFPIVNPVSFFFEPRFALMLCRDFREERYWEGSVVLGVDILGKSELWLSATYEPGYRNYVEKENDLYSDFYLNRVSIMGSVLIAVDTTLNLFIMHDPERHTRRDDDFSITLISIDLTRRF